MNDLHVQPLVPEDLPALRVALDGRSVTESSQWPARRAELRSLCVPPVYGAFPALPKQVRCEMLHQATVRAMEDARLWSCRVLADGAPVCLMRVFLPASGGPHPVVLHGDGCWHTATDGVIADLLRRGYAFAQFNRVEIAPDMPGPPRPVAALAAWAWGYHRAVDALCQLEALDATRIAVVGHSRGGKAALLAGATDERIALTSANNSGAGGAGCWRGGTTGAETLADITRVFGYWFAPALAQWAGREATLPFDQHFLKALVAPRALLTTEALGDHWANPQGTWVTHQAAQAVFDWLGVPQQLAIRYRAGEHAHTPADWAALLDFADHLWRGAPRPAGLGGPPDSLDGRGPG